MEYNWIMSPDGSENVDTPGAPDSAMVTAPAADAARDAATDTTPTPDPANAPGLSQAVSQE